MVSSSVMVWIIVSLIICFALPIVSYIVMQGKKQRIGRAFWFGALAFFVSQILLRIPLLNLLGQTFWYQMLATNPVGHGLFLGFTAGLFEEFARFFACKLLLKRNRRYIDSVAFGFGHGGIEAVLLTGVSLINVLVLITAINNGTLETVAGSAQNAAAIAQQLAALTPLNAALGGVERIIAVGIHISLSVVVFAGFVRNRPWQYLLYAILAHTVVDATVVILPRFIPMSAIALEGMVLVFTVALLLWAWHIKKHFPVPQDAPAAQINGILQDTEPTKEEDNEQ